MSNDPYRFLDVMFETLLSPRVPLSVRTAYEAEPSRLSVEVPPKPLSRRRKSPGRLAPAGADAGLA